MLRELRHKKLAFITAHKPTQLLINTESIKSCYIFLLIPIFLISSCLNSSLENKKTDFWIPAIFSDHMVLQQDTLITLWGRNTPGVKVSLIPDWTQKMRVKTGLDGHWTAILQAGKPGEVHTLKIKTRDTTLVFSDILFGEVWLCGGQSNMEYPLKSSFKSEEADDLEVEIRNAIYPSLRLFKVEKSHHLFPREDVKGKWIVCSPETVGDFSAVAYFFGKNLHKTLETPIGLISSSVGGTPAQVWVSRNGLGTIQALQPYTEVIDSIRTLYQRDSIAARRAFVHRTPTGYYNGMIAPLIPYTIRGTIFYQGEGNSRWQQGVELYPFLFPALINDWRKSWGYTFPFYYVQIAPFDYGEEYNAAVLREVQRRSLKVNNTGMVTTLDIGDPGDIHPSHKDIVGERLAKLALAKTYYLATGEYSGPMYEKIVRDKNRLILHFRHISSGLILKETPKPEFEIAGSDGQFYPAVARIEGDVLVLTSPDVPEPRNARYAWRNSPIPSLFNEVGLPASSFNTLEDFFGKK